MFKFFFSFSRMILMILVLLSTTGYTQGCGGGHLEFSVFSGGYCFNYEFIFVSPQATNYLQKKDFSPYSDTGVILDSLTVEQVRSNYRDSKLEQSLEKSKLNVVGTSCEKITLETLELLKRPVILKIIVNTKSVYVYGNVFGGCGEKKTLLMLGEKPYLTHPHETVFKKSPDFSLNGENASGSIKLPPL